MTDVSSSNIKAIGYDPEQKVLRVDFVSGSSYDYHDVPADLYEEFLSAPSMGKFLISRVKGVYEYEKL